MPAVLSTERITDATARPDDERAASGQGSSRSPPRGGSAWLLGVAADERQGAVPGLLGGLGVVDVGAAVVAERVLRVVDVELHRHLDRGLDLLGAGDGGPLVVGGEVSLDRSVDLGPVEIAGQAVERDD